MPENRPKKIAVLGGGISSLTTVAELTAQPDWQSKYDITVYQMGWRLGGKGASGRNQKMFNRIEEHGYHMWFGFYDNAFRLMRDIYKANGRPLNKPMATWSEAFKPVNYWVIVEHLKNGWVTWPLEFRANELTPGDDVPTRPSAAQFAGRAFRWLRDLLQSTYQTKSYNIDDDDYVTKEYLRHPKPFWEMLWDWIKGDFEVFRLAVMDRLLYLALTKIEMILHEEGDPKKHHHDLIGIIEKFIEKYKRHIQHELEDNMEARRLWILIDFLTANIRGMIFDGVISENNFDVINKWDYREWLKRHGATDFTVKSPLVDGFYALVFAGHYNTYEAGTALRATIELLLNYKGSVYWKMQAGMGDIVFAPIYEVLKKRGVKFKFFHKVMNVKPSTDGKTIESVTISQQATVKSGEYEPLFDVKGLPCWPSEPFFDQLVQGEQLQEQNINLESFWAQWPEVAPDRPEVVLQAGVDFDEVVLGISISALPYICGEIIAAHPEWRSMIANVKAIPTMGIQLWMYPDAAGLKSPMWRNEICMVSTYVEPCDTWADKTDILPRECWPDNYFPNGLAYICGPMKPDVEIKPRSDHGFPKEAKEIVKDYASHYLNKHANYLWEEWTIPKSDPPEPRWELLVDPQNRQGEARLEGQYFRANVDPTEHYVLSVTNSTCYRLRADQSGYSNMYLTGDWTKNPLNAGCIEAAVMSGMLTALAVQGKPMVIQQEPVGPAAFVAGGARAAYV